MADGRSICGSDDDHVLLSKTESWSLNPEVYQLNYLRVNGDKLLWTNDLESLKNFLENVLKQQGKWLTPGGNTKHFKSSNGNIIINWYNKKQQTLSFQGPDGPSLRDNLVDLVQKKPGTTTDLQDPDALVQLSKQHNLYYGKQTVIRNVIAEYRSTTWDRQIVGKNDQIQILWPTLRD